MNFNKALFILVCVLLAGSFTLHAQTVDTFKQHPDTIHTPAAVIIGHLPDSAWKGSDTVRTYIVTHALTDSMSVVADTARKDTATHTALQGANTGNNYGGYTIHGKVTDLHTNEGIPFATVFFPGSPIGTPTDIDGNFVLKASSLPGDTLRIQALGYATINKLLTPAKHDYNFILDIERSNAQLNEVTVRAEGVDPALLLLRRIIAHKPENNPDRAENYNYQAYNKLEMDIQHMSKAEFEKIPILKNYAFIYNDLDTEAGKPFVPLYLTETISDYYYREHPKKQREFIKGSMIKGVKNTNVIKYLGTLYQNVNIYKNYIPVFDKKFISPISNDGAFFYKYTIKDTEQAYGRNIILVQFQPRRPGENCFYGNFWVVDSLYALQRVNLELPKLANVNWVERVNIYQEFAPINDSTWFVIKDKFIAAFSAYNSQKLPGMIGRKTTTYQHIKVNDPAVDSVLDDKQWRTDVIVSDSAKNRNDQWFATHRPDTLSRNERRIYHMVDTINSMPITNFYKNLITFLASGVKDFGPIQLGPYFYVYSNNSVEGNRFRLSLGTPRSVKDAHVTGFLAYGDKDQQFKYGFTGLWLLDRKQRTYLYGEYIHDINHSPVYADQLGSDNIFSSLFRKPGIPWKLAFTDEQRFEAFREYYSGFSHKLILQHQSFTPYAPLPAAGIFTDNNGKPSNAAVSTEAAVDLRYAYKEKFVEGQYLRVSLGSKYPIIHLQLTTGIKNVLNSGYEYQKARLTVHEDVNIPPLGHLYYNVYVGKIFGTLPYPLLEVSPGNEYYYYNPYAFEMMNTYEFISDQFAGINIEHSIGSGIFHYIPGLKKLKLRQFWTAKGIIGSLSDANTQLNLNKGYPFRTLQGDPYLELGTGVANILQLFRVDFVWRVTPSPLATEARSKYFGIFGSIVVAF